MTQTTHTEKMATGAAPVTVERPGSVDSALERLWHFLTSMKLALILMLAFAALTLLGALVIQAPPGVMDDPQARAEWLAGIRPRFGGWTDLLDRLQVFTIFTSIWLRAIGALLAASLIACTVARIPGTWRTMRSPHVNVGPAFFEHAPQHEAMTFHRSSDEVLATAQAVFKRRHYRALTEDDGTVHLYFDRNRWAPWGGLVAHISIVVILAGAMVGSMLGFRDSQFMLAEGATSAIPRVAGATITLNSFKDTYNTTTGAPLDYVSDVTVMQDGKEVLSQQVRVNEPLRYGGVSFYQAFFGPAAVVTVKDDKGTVLRSEGVPLAWESNNGGNKVGTFTLPDRNLAVWVVATTGPNDPSVKPGQIAIETYAADTGDPITQQSIDQGVATTIDGLTYTFEREAKFTGLSVAADPGTPLVWLGCFLLVAGFAVRLYVPYRRVWGRLTPRPDGGSSLSIAAVGRKDTGFDEEFTSIVTDIRQALTAQAKS
ncbi:MAG: cytochrome c biogenesis protein ResB [Chloroflexi bacterium]|jgi:cytochrome c biogenesis protein|nr:cytochrome c biogenesis protein ResB [Chloroflexota bacterium]